MISSIKSGADDWFTLNLANLATLDALAFACKTSLVPFSTDAIDKLGINILTGGDIIADAASATFVLANSISIDEICTTCFTVRLENIADEFSFTFLFAVLALACLAAIVPYGTSSFQTEGGQARAVLFFNPVGSIADQVFVGSVD